ncbi:hypothetical protein ACFL0F_00130 [Patescibacteria group bacterium]
MKKKGFPFNIIGLVTAIAIVVGINYYPDFRLAGAKKPPDNPSNCVCTGIGKCKRNTSESACLEDSKCTWSCKISQPTIITPNGGEVWMRGNAYEIIWEQYQSASSTGLFLYTRNETGDQYIGAIEYHVSNVVGTNKYVWTIPQIGSQQTTPPQDGDNIIVAVAQYDSDGNRIVEDKSDATFTIISSQPRIITPNGGEVWIRGNTYEIVWEQNQKAASTGLFLYTRNDTGDQYLGAIEYYVSNVVGTNRYLWTIPPIGSSWTTPPQDGNNILVGVAQYNSNGQRISSDISDSTFTITSNIY